MDKTFNQNATISNNNALEPNQMNFANFTPTQIDPTLSAKVKVTEQINPTTLKNTTPTLPISSQPDLSFMNSLQTGNPASGLPSAPSLQTDETTAQGAVDQTTAQIKELMGQLGYKSQDVANLQEQSNLKGLQGSLADLNTKFAQSKADYAQKLQKIGSQNIPSLFSSGQLALERAAMNSDLGSQAAQIQAAQGNLETAYSTIDKTIEQKYKPIEDNINAQLKYYELNKDKLTSAQKKLADRQTDILNAQKQELVVQQKMTTDAIDLIKDAITKGKVDGKIGINAVADLIQGKSTTDEVLRKLNISSPTGGGTGGAKYDNDLDAITGTVLSTIPSKFGQQTFNEQIKKARNDGDKLNIVAAQVLKGQPAEFKNDFRNQAVGIAQIDKAIAEIDKGVQTGLLNNAAQYVYNQLGKDFDPNLAKINGYITAAIQPYRNSVTGAAWGDQEEGEYNQLFGSTKYSPTELKQRLLQTKELLKSKSSEGLNAFVNPLGTYENQFEIKTQSGTSAPSVEIKDLRSKYNY